MESLVLKSPWVVASFQTQKIKLMVSEEILTDVFADLAGLANRLRSAHLVVFLQGRVVGQLEWMDLDMSCWTFQRDPR